MNRVSYCINPECPEPQNPGNPAYCQACGSRLLINNRYRAVKLLREGHSDTYEVDDGGTAKILKVQTAQSSTDDRLFEQEARILTELEHPGIPKAEPDGYFSFRLSNGQELPCLVMEKIEGQNLEEYLLSQQNEPISQELAISWLRELTEILGLVHQQELLHRDIKPSNIMLKTNGQIVLIDFGTAREVTHTYIKKLPGGDITRVYSSGYTAPEQVLGQAVEQSDFFALGRTFVRLLTGKNQADFPKDSQERLIWRRSAPQVSKLFADLIDDLMAPSPKQRPQNTQLILQRLVILSLESSIRSSVSELPQPLKFLAEQILQHQLQRWEKQSKVPKIALYGRSGSGKSSLINAIMGDLVAKVGVAVSETQDSEPYEYQRHGWKLNFVDSRGVGDSRDDAAFQQAINYIVKQKVDILLFVIPANERGYVTNDVKFLTALQREHLKAHKVKLPIILVLNKIDLIDPPFEWSPPYELSFAFGTDDGLPKSAREAKQANILACVAARLNDYKELTSTYVPVCAFWDNYGNRLHNIEALALQIYNCIPDEAAKQGFGGATADTSLKKAVASTFTLAAAWFAFLACLLPIPAVEARVMFATEFRLVSMIAQIAATNEDQSNVAEEFLKQLGVKQTDARSPLSMILAIGEAAIRYFIEGESMKQAKQAFAQEKERREPEFKEAEEKGPEKVAGILIQIDKELNERYGFKAIYLDTDV